MLAAFFWNGGQSFITTTDRVKDSKLNLKNIAEIPRFNILPQSGKMKLILLTL